MCLVESASCFKAACIQISAQADMAENLAVTSDFVRRAAADGARLIVTPENVAFMAQSPDRVRSAARPESGHPGVSTFSDLARETKAWVLAGSLNILGVNDQQKKDQQLLANRSLLFDPQGAIAARYDKIHMFDADPGDQERYRESETYRPGEQAVVARTPWGGIGLSICYDVRFAYLYRALAQAGAFLFTVPAAFTRPTGQAHWRSLLRARAIECGCYVLAPAQCGEHDGGRTTHGHSMIIDPWGSVMAEIGDDPGYIVAEIDPQRSLETRSMIPALSHDRSFSGPL